MFNFSIKFLNIFMKHRGIFMHKKRKRIASSRSSFTGNGRLTPYKDKKDSWVWGQILSGKVNPGIKTNRKDGHLILAKLKRMAFNIIASDETIVISRYAKQRSSTSTNNYRFALKWTLGGDLEGATINELEMSSNLLQSRVEADLASLKDNYTTSLEKQSAVSVDFIKKRLFVDALVSFDVNIMTDETKIRDTIQELGFDFGATVQDEPDEIDTDEEFGGVDEYTEEE